MKSKYFVLLTICSLFCILGCSCKREQPQSGSSDSSSTESTSQEEIIISTTPIISVNQDALTLSVGQTYTLVAEAENVESPVFTWSVDGDCAEDIVSISQSGNTATVTALKVGETKLVATMEHDGHLYFRSVEVTVKEDSGVALVLSDNIGFDNNGYHVDLSTLSTENGDTTSIVPIVTAYKNNKIVAVDDFVWSSENTEIVSVDGNKFVSASEGSTKIIGACTIEGEQYTVEISVNVYRPTISLGEKFVVELENLETLHLHGELKGITRDVLYNGKSVGAFDSQAKTVTLTKSKLPTDAASLGENRQFVIETSLASYLVDVDLYTKIISNKEEFDNLATLSKRACYNDDAIWDGYFVLDSDIEYNGLFESRLADTASLWNAVGGSWSNGGLYGFKGVLDGKGHSIEGLSINNGSNMGGLVGVLHIDGVIKNLSFTKASVAANSSLVCGAGGGTVENIYIQYDSIGKGAQHYEGDGSVNTYCGSFFSFKEPTATANVSNCIIDVTNAFFNTDTEIKIVGSEFVSIKNVFVIGGTDALRADSNATLAFQSVMDFVNDSNAQGRYKKFDENFWALADGVPVSQNIFEKVSDQAVHFTETTEYLVAGTAYKFALDNSYAVITSNNENVAINGSVATVSGSVTSGEQVVITATSIFDATKTDTFTCSLLAIDPANCVDLTSEKETAFYDITEAKVYLAELGAKINDEVLYFVDTDFATPIYGKDGDPTQTIIAVAKDKYYKFNCQSVTKVLSKAEDLHYVRRDYTVSSYGNSGCYDSVLTGTFVMINDIDCSDLVLGNSGTYWENSRGFQGTFDGRGYTISNLSVSKNGLFGALSYATIKNVTFTGVKLKAADQGAYVALLSNRVFNTLVENVVMQFSEYVASTDVYHSSGLMFYETSFDCTFKNVTIDISQVSGVRYVTECFYEADIPYQSQDKSTYENITVIVANLDEAPAFAYKSAQDSTENIVPYPDGFTIRDVEGNVKA